MAWPTYTADVTQNSNQIKLYGAVPASYIPLGDEVIVYGATVTANLEVASGSAIMYDGNGSPYSFLYLARPYTGQSSTGVEVVIKPTGSLARDIVEIFRKGTDQSNQLMSNYHQFAEGTTPITHQPLDENAAPLSIKTLPMMEDEVEQAISQFQGAAGTAYAYDVTESATDTSNGANGQPRLLKRGDFGFGGNPSFLTVDFNDQSRTTPQRVGFNSSSVNGPTDGISGNLTVERFGDTTPARFLQKIESTNGDVIAIRYGTTDETTPIFQSWKEILHTGNTGSIITEDRTYATGILAYSTSSYGVAATTLTTSTIVYNEVAGSVTGEFHVRTDSSDIVEVGDCLVMTGFAYPYAGDSPIAIGTFLIYDTFTSQRYGTGKMWRDGSGGLYLTVDFVVGSFNWTKRIRGSFSFLD